MENVSVLWHFELFDLSVGLLIIKKKPEGVLVGVSISKKRLSIEFVQKEILGGVLEGIIREISEKVSEGILEKYLIEWILG